VLADAIAAVQAVRAWRNSAEVKPSAVLPARLAAPGYDELAGQVARLTRLELDSADGGEPVAAVPVPRVRSRSWRPRTWTWAPRSANVRPSGPS